MTLFIYNNTPPLGFILLQLLTNTTSFLLLIDIHILMGVVLLFSVFSQRRKWLDFEYVFLRRNAPPRMEYNVIEISGHSFCRLEGCLGRVRQFSIPVKTLSPGFEKIWTRNKNARSWLCSFLQS